MRKVLRQLGRRLGFAFERRGLAGSREIRVQVIDGWGDAERALADMTVCGSGRVGRVHFAMRHEAAAHYLLVLTKLPTGDAPAAYPSRRIWYLIGEPPIEANRWLYETPQQNVRVWGVTLPPAFAAALRHANEHPAMPCPLRTWHVGKSLSELQGLPLPKEKPKLLSWITSARRTHEGHRRRMDFLERLRGKFDFDLYGRGFRPIDDKWQGLAPYRYSIAFENSVFDDYFTEKLVDPILAGALPIYCGCPNLERYLPADAFLRFDPDDPLAIDRIRDWIDSDLWRERRPALEEAKALLLERYNCFNQLARAFEADFAATFGRQRPAEVAAAPGAGGAGPLGDKTCRA